MQFAEHFFHAGRLDGAEHFVLLQNFAADVQGQVFGVDDAAQEAHPGGQQFFIVVGDKHPLDVQLHSGFEVGLEQIEGLLAGNKKQSGVLHRSFGLGVEPHQRLFPVSRKSFVELLVIFVLQLALGALPQGIGRIDLLGGVLFDRFFLALVPLALVVGHVDGKGDMVAVLFDDVFDFPRRGVFLAFLVEVHDDGGAVFVALGGLDLEARLPVAGPAPGFFLTGLAANHFHAVGDHEHRVKPHAKLADEVAIALGIAGELAQEVFGTRAGDGAQVGHEVFVVHADAGIGNAQRVVLFVEIEIDARIEGQRLVGVLGEGEVFEFIERVRSVRNQFPQEDLLVGVEGMDDQLQQLVDFGLKLSLGHENSFDGLM